MQEYVKEKLREKMSIETKKTGTQTKSDNSSSTTKASGDKNVKTEGKTKSVKLYAQASLTAAAT